MQIIFKDDSTVAVELLPSPVYDLVQRWFHHLKHVDLPFRPWEYVGYVEQRTVSELIDDLISYGRLVSVEVDPTRALEQNYLNELHRMYERCYDGTQTWTDYHEHIHLLENKLRGKLRTRCLEMNYRHLSGPLNRPFQFEWLAYGQTKLRAGDVYLAWDELGKAPYTYWRDSEPDDLHRLCELAKPWVTIRPKIHVCLEDTDLDPGENPDFQKWWASFEKEWCRHYGIPSWSRRDSNTVLVIGKVQNHRALERLLDKKIWPERITL